MVTKLGVQVLPCVLIYIDGVCVDRILGFEGLGEGSDKFTTHDLENRLLASSVLLRAKTGSHRCVPKSRTEGSTPDEDDDWD